MIELRDVEVKYGGSSIVEGVSFRVEPGAFVGLAGANGSGKTSLMKVIAGLLLPAKGTVLIGARAIESYGRRELARLIAGVWPRTPLSFGFTVRQLVLLGRTPHLSPMRWETPVDQEIAVEAMQETQIAHLAERPASQLSAGELQRVFIATALAQQSAILLLDEPTSFLDLRQAALLSSLLERLHRRGVTILCASHDLALLRRHASSVVLLADHRVAVAGDPASVLVPETLQRAFEITPEEWYD
ncbi:MAG TPA: ABC transporter ATP-binding protein [Thermoanaerobaculia bacterium]|nr:ABC transporter ATP-binding protein [Thermoanaerobaculia bacterium]